MGDKSAIAWTDATWNPVIGCTKVSAGCTACYAIQVAHRLDVAFHQAVYAGLTEQHHDGSLNWTGEVRCLPERLGQPLRWQKPRRIFVNSMSDLFHDGVPTSFIAQVFGVMGAASQHTFQVLTKRPERMQRLLSEPSFLAMVQDAFAVAIGESHREWWAMGWPLPNVWLGVSAEDQAAADTRIQWLARTAAAVRFISGEPMIGAIDLHNVRIQGDREYLLDCLAGEYGNRDHKILTSFGMANLGRISWVILGGESGPGHRPLNLDWVRDVARQCAQDGVPLFVKQDSGPRPGTWGRIPQELQIRQFPA